MKKEDKKIEINVKVNTNAIVEDDYEEPDYDERYYNALNISISTFSFLAANVMSTEDACRIVGNMEHMLVIGGCSEAVEVLRTVFCSAGMKCGVCAIDHILSEGEDNPDIICDFVDELLDSEVLDWFVVEGYLGGR